MPLLCMTSSISHQKAPSALALNMLTRCIYGYAERKSMASDFERKPISGVLLVSEQGAEECCMRCAQAEADSQVQLYKAQISKMQLALERADQENSRVEQQLRIALEAPGKLREAQAERRASSVGGASLAALRDRVRSMSLLGPSVEAQAAERLQVQTASLHASQQTSPTHTHTHMHIQ